MIPLQCKWFNINNETQEFMEIEGVSGAFYQPCAEDVGMK